MKHLSALLLTLCCLVRLSAAEDYLFRQLDSNSGLPDNNVRNMLMLPNGLMCIQTSTVLNLYDGAACRGYAFNPIRIPYHEYSGMNYLCYDRDHRLWLSNRDNTWRFDLNTRQFEYDTHRLFSALDRTADGIESFFMDNDGNYWIGSADGHLWLYDRTAAEPKAIDRPETLHGPVVMVHTGQQVWMLSLDGTLACYNTRLGQFTSVMPQLIAASAPLQSRMEMAATSQGDLWIMFDRDLICYRTDSGRIERIRTVPLAVNDIYTSIAVDKRDNVWIGSAKSGVSILDGATRQVRNLPCLELTDGAKIDHQTDISKIYIDPHDGVWIATLTEGLLYWHKNIFRLHTLNNASLTKGSMPDQSVKCLVEQPDGGLLLGTTRGLLRYDPRTDAVSVPYPELRNELCISLYRDRKGRIWLGTFHNGAFRIDNGTIRHYFHADMPSVDVSYHDATPNFNCVRSFHEDGAGNFWISVYGGLGRFDPETGAITLLRAGHPELNQFMITRGVCEVGDKLLVTSDNGRYVYVPGEDRVIFDAQDPTQHTPCNQAIVDGRGMVWLASSDGLRIRIPEGRDYLLTTQDGLPNDNILSIVPDNLGNVWIATFGAVARIRPIPDGNGYRFAVSAYGQEDGMAAGALFQHAVTRSAGGVLYFGGVHGFCAVDPSQLYQQNYNITPLISSLLIFDRHIEIGAQYNGRCILPRELSQTRQIDLHHDETFLTFEFSNLNYINPSHTVYRYKLENFDKEWTEIHARRTGSATYTLLEPGDYTFRVMAADNDTDWSSACAEIAVRIHPPFWKSTAALLVYILLILLFAVAAVLYALRRLRRRAARRSDEERQRQQEELDQLKFRFFTNISHELRTPLSLIILPLESIIRRVGEDSPFSSQLHTIHRHATQLLQLVNHLLDFRKLEMHGERLNLTQGDIAEFVEGLVDTFRDVAHEKEVDLTFDNRMTNSYMAFDATQMYKIVNNLLSNAVKFTPKGGSIAVRLARQCGENGEMMSLEVADTGIGIALKECEHIFERFYQSTQNTQPQGSGIGLCLVKQYAEMHGGSVSVSSEVGKGSVFRVEIPATLHIAACGEESAAVDPGATDSVPALTDGGAQRHRLLIVEDNADFRHYVAEELSEKYEVLEAVDGEDGLRKAHKHHPDILVCDVMMPRMDGFEVCRQLKNDIDTSHIPIILLTARTDDDVRREGYESGADAYIAKPFKMELLEARIRNLIEERARRIRHFSSTVDISPSQITVTSLDQKLIEKIMRLIEQNMDKPDYSIEELSSDVGMHRMNLYRKLQSITGMTPSEFLRTVRLKRAAQLLMQDRNLTVTEVADRVGFNTPKYFTRYFREMFGLSPLQYAAQADKQSEQRPEA